MKKKFTIFRDDSRKVALLLLIGNCVAILLFAASLAALAMIRLNGSNLYHGLAMFCFAVWVTVLLRTLKQNCAAPSWRLASLFKKYKNNLIEAGGYEPARRELVEELLREPSLPPETDRVYGFAGGILAALGLGGAMGVVIYWMFSGTPVYVSWFYVLLVFGLMLSSCGSYFLRHSSRRATRLQALKLLLLGHVVTDLEAAAIEKHIRAGGEEEL